MMQPTVFTVQLFRKPSDIEECDRRWSGPCQRPRFFKNPINTDFDVERSKKCLLVMLEALTNIDSLWLADYPDTPGLYQSGVVYRPELEKTEEWQDIPTTLMKGWGDCEDLGAWRTAELRAQGEKARPYIRWRMVEGTWRFHTLVQRENGGIEDPSLVLGMAKWRDVLAKGL